MSITAKHCQDHLYSRAQHAPCTLPCKQLLELRMLNHFYLPHCFIDSISKPASFTWIITLKCFGNHIEKYAEEGSWVGVLNVTQFNEFHIMDLFLTYFSINMTFRGLSTDTKLCDVWLWGRIAETLMYRWIEWVLNVVCTRLIPVQCYPGMPLGLIQVLSLRVKPFLLENAKSCPSAHLIRAGVLGDKRELSLWTSTLRRSNLSLILATKIWSIHGVNKYLHFYPTNVSVI